MLPLPAYHHLRRFVQGKLGLDWRRWLTEHLCGLYFSNRAFYALKIGYLPSNKASAGASAGSASKGKDVQQDGGGNDGDAACCPEEEEQQRGGIDNPVSAVSHRLAIVGCNI